MKKALVPIIMAAFAAFSIPLWSGIDMAPSNWPGADYAEVRAYYYNPEGDMYVPILEKGVLHKSLVNKGGARLTPEQVKRLLAAITGKHRDYSSAMCFEPRHAFVFYDNHHKPVGFFEMCLDCREIHVSPAGLEHPVDFPALADLISELKL